MNAPPNRVVYLLMTYNHEALVADAVVSALAQTYEPLEICISDDSSDDATFAIINSEVARYAGPHKVTLNRNARRLGSVEHLSTIVEKIGHDAFYIMAHGDDIAHANRTEVQVNAWHQTRASMVTCAINWMSTTDNVFKTGESRFITAEEIIRGWLPEMLGATIAFDARILSFFAPLTAQTLSRGLDHVLPLRAAAMNGFYFVAEALVDYRVHATNMSNVFRDSTQPGLILEERHAAYELALGTVQKADIFRLARRHAFSARHWRLALAIWSKQRWRSSNLKRLRKSISSQTPVDLLSG